MVGTIVHQLTKDASVEEIERTGLGAYYTDHGVDVYPSSAAGVPFTAAYAAVPLRIFFVVSLKILFTFLIRIPILTLSSKVCKLVHQICIYLFLLQLHEQKQVPDVIEPLRFLRQREVVHFQRFGEALRGVQDKLAQKKFYMNDCKEDKKLMECTKDFNMVNNLDFLKLYLLLVN